MKFIGRTEELKLLKEWNQTRSELSVIYGRRRIGKTRLIEEATKGITFFRFEGLEGQASNEQKAHFCDQIEENFKAQEAKYLKNQKWKDILIFLSRCIGEKTAIVLFDEFQWIAANQTQLVSELKFVWDNYFLKDNMIHLILCGSISSFMVKKVIHSKALYGRVDHEFSLLQLNIHEVKQFFKPPRSPRELIEFSMFIGGIPQYLLKIDKTASIRLNMEKLCFRKNGYLVTEFEKIFISHFGEIPHYRNIITTLSHRRFASREELEKLCNIRNGGRLTHYLEELELAGFIEEYAPLEKNKDNSRLLRYRLSDPYILFYFRFIYPSLNRIRRSTEATSIDQFISPKQYEIWTGLAFELFCYHHSETIAQILGFSSVKYDCGSWFSRDTVRSGAQIDLVFFRADRVITVCEMKFKQNKIGTEIVPEMEEKLKIFPNPKKYTIEKILITASDPTEDLLKTYYFNKILQLEDFIKT